MAKQNIRKDDCIFKDTCNPKTHQCTDWCQRYLQFNRLLELSNLPKIYKKPIKIIANKDDYNAYTDLDAISKDIDNFVKSGKNLYICSTTPGNAKTTWAAKLMLNYFNKVWPNSYDMTRGLFVHIPTLMLDLKKFDDIPEYINRIKDADLVIWDDLAATNKLTEYEHEQLLQFIDYRIQNELSNIYTSNITDPTLLIQNIGARLASRVYTGSKIITFIAKDFRAGGNL